MEIECGRCRNQLQMGFGATDIARAAQVTAMHSLRNGSFNARPFGILLPEGGSLLCFSALLKRFMLRLGVQDKGAGTAFGLRTECSARTSLTGAGFELDLN